MAELEIHNSTSKYLIGLNVRAVKERITNIFLNYKQLDDEIIKILALCTNLKNLSWRSYSILVLIIQQPS